MLAVPFFVHPRETVQENPLLDWIKRKSRVDFGVKLQNSPPPTLRAASGASERCSGERENPPNTSRSREPSAKTSVCMTRSSGCLRSNYGVEIRIQIRRREIVHIQVVFFSRLVLASYCRSSRNHALPTLTFAFSGHLHSVPSRVPCIYR